MDWQTFFNIALGLASGLGGFVLHAVWSGVQQLRKDLQDLERATSTTFVRRDDFQRATDRIETKLDQIYAALSSKADKP